MITPTVGRIVWYKPHPAEVGFQEIKDQVAAIITRVHDDRCVDLTVFPPDAMPTYGTVRVPLLQDDDEKPARADSPYCMWMPYQKGQAAKTEKLEKQVESFTSNN